MLIDAAPVNPVPSDWQVKSWDVRIRFSDGRERNLYSETHLIVGRHNNLEIPLVEGGWVCYAGGTWLSFTAEPSEGQEG